MANNERAFQLNVEQRDALRLEAQSLSPEDWEKFKQLAAECSAAMLSVYGEYIEDTLTSEEMAEKFVVMTPETYSNFWKNWDDSKIQIISSSNEGYFRYSKNLGDFVGGYVPDVWSHVDKGCRERLIAERGDEVSARDYVQNTTLRYCLVHEMIHVYQDQDIPLWLMECAAHYGARKVMKVQDWDLFDYDKHRKMANFYLHLVNKYGNDVHRLCFGQEVGETKKQQILAEFTDSFREKIMPGYGTRTRNDK
ncbi:hypothetical protein KKB83_03935 [Patescibacteria group bacterium]|nr:hypothetical protein [Patescibacteria group bacterium]